jgi:hypothetical protein
MSGLEKALQAVRDVLGHVADAGHKRRGATRNRVVSGLWVWGGASHRGRQQTAGLVSRRKLPRLKLLTPPAAITTTTAVAEYRSASFNIPVRVREN